MRLLVCPEAWRQFGATRQERAVNLAALSRRGDLRALVAEGREMSPGEPLQTRATTVFADVIDSFSDIDIARGWRVAPSWAAGHAVLAAVRHAVSAKAATARFLALARPVGVGSITDVVSGPWQPHRSDARRELFATKTTDGIWTVFLMREQNFVEEIDAADKVVGVSLWPDLSIRLLDRGPIEYSPKVLSLAVQAVVEAARKMIKEFGRE